MDMRKSRVYRVIWELALYIIVFILLMSLFYGLYIIISNV